MCNESSFIKMSSVFVCIIVTSPILFVLCLSLISLRSYVQSKLLMGLVLSYWSLVAFPLLKSEIVLLGTKGRLWDRFAIIVTGKGMPQWGYWLPNPLRTAVPRWWNEHQIPENNSPYSPMTYQLMKGGEHHLQNWIHFRNWCQNLTFLRKNLAYCMNQPLIKPDDT